MSIIRNIARASALMFAAAVSVASANSISLSGPASVNVGDSFSITVLGDFTSGGLFGGGLNLGFDPALVSVDSITLGPDGATDSDFSCPSTTGNANCISTATTAPIHWGNFAGVLAAGHAPNPASMATINLTALAAGVAAFTTTDDPNAGGWFDQGFGNATPSFGGTSVTINSTVVPVPAAVWLFGSGLLGLVSVARRKAA